MEHRLVPDIQLFARGDEELDPRGELKQVDDRAHARQKMLKTIQYDQPVFVAQRTDQKEHSQQLLESSRHMDRIIRKLAEHPQWKDETIVICDRDGVLYKPGDSDREGFYEPSSPASTRRHLELFEELWRHSAEDVELRSLAL